VSRQPFEPWTRTEENKERLVFSELRARRQRIRRGALALLGVALILFSAGFMFADIRSVGEAATAVPTSDRLKLTKSDRLKLTIPKMKRVRNIPVYDGAAGDKGKLAVGTLHLKDTGFPWEAEANVYIAGHRLGYPRTKSFLVFWNLDKLRRGDRVVLKDSEGRRYVYEVFNKLVVGPNDVSVKEPMEGKNIVTLQTCTLPNYKRRLLVQARLIL
jgi:sortase A